MWRRGFFASLRFSSICVAASLASACQGNAPEPYAQQSSPLEQAWSANSLELDDWRQIAAPYPLITHTSTALDDGRVLVVGGEETEGDETPMSAVDTAYVFTPADETWTQLPPMNEPRLEHAATKLADGRVLIVGGRPDYFAFTYSKTAELFDPITSSWTQVLSELPKGRALPSPVLLPDGNVLVIGGYDDDDVASSVELYDPSDGPTGSWSSGPGIDAGRAAHTAVVLPSGAVLVSGGHDAGYGMVDTNLELAPPYDATWVHLSPLTDDRKDHTATLLADGRVLVAGGENSMEQRLNSVEIVGDTVVPAASMYSERSGHTAALLPDGRVIVVGGENMNGPLNSTEIYDPLTDTWSFGPELNTRRASHTMVAVPGRIIVFGGHDEEWNMLASVEILELTSALGASCSMDAECSSGHCVDGVCCDNSCEGACVACAAALKGAGDDGRCEIVAKGTNPRSLCEDEGAASCGLSGVCDANGSCAVYEDGTECAEGMSCWAGECVGAPPECTGKPNGVVCAEGDGCTLGLCRDGACVETHKLDGTRCEGGVCIAGECKLDREATPPPGAGGQGPGSGDDDPNGQTPGGSRQGAADGEGGGGGCSIAHAASRSSSTLATGFALLAAIGLLRRRGNAEG